VANTALRRLFTLQLSNTFAESFGWAFVYIYAHEALGLGYMELIWIFLLGFGVAIPFMLAMRDYSGKGLMLLGLGLKAAAFIILFAPLPAYKVYLAAPLYGLCIPFFWVPYNSHFVLRSEGHRRASASTSLFALFAFANSLLPLVGGRLISMFDYWLVFAGAAIVLFLGMAYLLRMPGEAPIHLSGTDILKDAAATARFILPEGVWQGAFMIGVPLGTLFFITDPANYGLFLAFLGAMGGVASILAGRWSDKVKDRRMPTLLFACAAMLFSILSALSTGRVEFWGLAVGATYFAIYGMMGFTFTLTQECCVSASSGMVAREIWLNVGRVVGGLTVLSCVVFLGTLAPALALGGVVLAGIAVTAVRLGR